MKATPLTLKEAVQDTPQGNLLSFILYVFNTTTTFQAISKHSSFPQYISHLVD